jgi:hypothetical protein
MLAAHRAKQPSAKAAWLSIVSLIGRGEGGILTGKFQPGENDCGVQMKAQQTVQFADELP